MSLVVPKSLLALGLPGPQDTQSDTTCFWASQQGKRPQELCLNLTYPITSPRWCNKNNKHRLIKCCFYRTGTIIRLNIIELSSEVLFNNDQISLHNYIKEKCWFLMYIESDLNLMFSKIFKIFLIAYRWQRWIKSSFQMKRFCPLP